MLWDNIQIIISYGFKSFKIQMLLNQTRSYMLYYSSNGNYTFHSLCLIDGLISGEEACEKQESCEVGRR